MYNDNSKDVANTIDFWMEGNNLSRKIDELSLKSTNGDWINIWNRNTGSVTIPLQQQIVQGVNVIKNDVAVDFCHTVDLSGLPFRISQVLIRAVTDVTLFIHLNGQLFKSQSYYEVANEKTLKIYDYYDEFIHLFGSEVSLQFEETSFQNISSTHCVKYNATWTYDDCLLDKALIRLGDKKDLLKSLLRPERASVEAGIERSVLQKFLSTLLSEEVENNCRPDCRSLVVRMLAEASPIHSIPKNGIAIHTRSSPQPLPPLLVDLKMTIPESFGVDEVRIS